MQYPSEDEFVAQTETELRQRVDELWAQPDVPYQFFVMYSLKGAWGNKATILEFDAFVPPLASLGCMDFRRNPSGSKN